MLVNNYQWCASIVLFQSKPSLRISSSKFWFFRFVTSKVISFLILLLISHGDIEVNPGLKRKFSKFLCCHWNVNSILAHDTLQRYVIICISETYLDSSTNENYHILRAAHPNNLKIRGVSFYFKENLRLSQIETPYFCQCILWKLTMVSL